MRALLISNPAAGSSSRHRVEQFRHAAQLVGCTLDVVIPDSPAESDAVVQRSITAGYDRILCGGGDGTINRVAAILAGTDIPLAIIPTGTVNVLARELHIPLDPLQAIKIALQGPVRRIDIGTANDRSFILMAGLGFDARVVSDLVPRLKELFGSLAYVTTALQVLTRYKSSQFHLEVDGTPLSLPAWLIVVGNAGYYGYQVAVTPKAELDDGMLDVCIFAERNVLDRAMQIGAVFAGLHLKHPNVSYFRARRVRITADPRVHVQLDGDSAGFSPVDIGIRPSALSIVTPPVDA